MNEQMIKNVLAYKLLEVEQFLETVVVFDKVLTREAFSKFMDNLFLNFLKVRDQAMLLEVAISEFINKELIPNIKSYILSMWP